MAIICVVALAAFIVVNKRSSVGQPRGSDAGKISEQTQATSTEATGEAKLSWNANKELTIAGYRIYYGTTPRKEQCPPGGYPDKVDVGNKTTYTITGLKKKETYYFSTTSYNKGGKESCFSAEVKKTI